MEALGCDMVISPMWDPEYSVSELSSKSRDEMCPFVHGQTQLEVRRGV